MDQDIFNNDFGKDKMRNKQINNSDQESVNFIDIIFYVMLFIVIVCLIPYYNSIIEIFLTAAKAETGREIYYSMYALIVSVVIIISGFTTKNGIVKIFGLVLTTFFAVYPLNGYFSNNKMFKKVLNEYDFVSLNIVKNNTCSSSNGFQKQLTEQLISQYGDDGVQIEIENATIDENSTYKQKLKCMPPTTTMAYTISYKDFYGKKREIIYIDNDSFNDLLKVSSYEIIYEKIGEFLKEHQGKRKIYYKFYLLSNKIKLTDMTRKTLISESVFLEYPAYVSLANYNQDKRIVLEIKMSDLSKREEAHDLIDSLASISKYPLNIIIMYGKNTEYFIQGKYYDINSYQEYINLLNEQI